MYEDTQLVRKLEEIYKSIESTVAVEKKAQEIQTEEQIRFQTSKFCILPKSALRTIFLFLDFNTDIPSISEVCWSFHNIIKSRAFQLGLYKVTKRGAKEAQAEKHERSPSIVAEEAKKSEAHIEGMSQTEAVKQLKTANAIKDFLGQKIVAQDKKIKQLEDEVRIQKQINSKTIGKLSSLDQMYKEEKARADELEGKLFMHEQQHRIDVEKLNEQIEKHIGEREELQKDRKVLKAEVIKLREEQKKALQHLTQYRSALVNMKSYFEAMFSNRIKKLKLKHAKENIL
jgi:hypothetical protein